MKAGRLMIAAALFAAVPSTQAPAVAAPGDQGANAEVFAFCEALIDQYPGLSLGTCVAFNDTQGTYGFVPQQCHELQGLGLLDDFGFDSFDDCVRNAR